MMVAAPVLLLADPLPAVLWALLRRSRRAVRPSARSLALTVLFLLSSASTSSAASASELPRPGPSPSLTMDDAAADAPLLEGRWQEAIRLHQKLIARDPLNGRANYHLGYAYGQLENYAEEIAAYREAVRLGVRESLLSYNLGLALATVNQDYDGAIATFREGLKLDPNDAELWYNLGVAYLSKREFAPARDAFAAAIQRDPDHLEARNNLAHALAKLGDLKAARAEWEALLARSPGNPLATANLRWLEEQERSRKAGE